MSEIYHVKTEEGVVNYRVIRFFPLTIEYGKPDLIKIFGHTLGGTEDPFAASGSFTVLHVYQQNGRLHAFPPDASLQDVGDAHLLEYALGKKLLNRLPKTKLEIGSIDGVSPDSILADIESHHQEILRKVFTLQQASLISEHTRNHMPTEHPQKAAIPNDLIIPIALGNLWLVKGNVTNNSVTELSATVEKDELLFGEALELLQKRALPWEPIRVDVAIGRDTRSKPARLLMSAGVHVIIGAANTGKTALTMAITTSQPTDTSRIIYLEPPEMSVLHRQSQVVLASEGDLALKLASSLTDERKSIIIVDSFRALFYAPSRGGTGAGGVNMSLYTHLTMLDIIARVFGKLLLIVINPLTNDQAKLDYYIEAAEGSVEGVIIPTGVDVAAKTLAFTSRSRTIGNRRSRDTVINLPPRHTTAEMLDLAATDAAEDHTLTFN